MVDLAAGGGPEDAVGDPMDAQREATIIKVLSPPLWALRQVDVRVLRRQRHHRIELVDGLGRPPLAEGIAHRLDEDARRLFPAQRLEELLLVDREPIVFAVTRFEGEAAKAEVLAL